MAAKGLGDNGLVKPPTNCARLLNGSLRKLHRPKPDHHRTPASRSLPSYSSFEQAPFPPFFVLAPLLVFSRPRIDSVPLACGFRVGVSCHPRVGNEASPSRIVRGRRKLLLLLLRDIKTRFVSSPPTLLTFSRFERSFRLFGKEFPSISRSPPFFPFFPSFFYSPRPSLIG